MYINTLDIIMPKTPVSGKVLFTGTEYELVKKEMEKPYDYRSVIYAIEHILSVYEKDISPNLHNKLTHWKKNIQEDLDKEQVNDSNSMR